MAKRTSFNPRRISDIPSGPWVAHSAELISSKAWQARSIHVVRLLDRIELEHCAHAGRENGYLVVTYDQFVVAGIGRRFIKRAIAEAERLGLLVVYPGMYRGGAKARPNLYRLTYLKSKHVPAAGAPYYLEPTHDWRHFKPEKKARKSIRMVTHGEPSRVTGGEPSHAPTKQSSVTNIADFTARRQQ